MNTAGLRPPPGVEASVTTVADGTCGAAIWDSLGSHRAFSLFTSKPWMETIAAAYGFTIAAAVRLMNGDPTAALFYSQISDIRGDRIISFPFSDFCGPLVTDLDDWRELVTPLLAHRVPVSIRCLRSDVVDADDRFRPIGQLAWHGADLARSEDAIWVGLTGAARTTIRKARSQQLVVREGRTLDDVRRFYEMHCHVRKRKYRLLPQPFAFFENLYAAFAPHQLTVLLAEDQGTPIAGSVFIEWADTLYYKFNASVDQSSAPNDLILWEAMRMGRRRGLKLLDFGASDLDQPGLIRFKRKYATDERAIIRYRWEPPGYDSAHSRRADHLLDNVTELLTDPAVPDTITQAAGERLYGLFS